MAKNLILILCVCAVLLKLCGTGDGNVVQFDEPPAGDSISVPVETPDPDCLKQAYHKEEGLAETEGPNRGPKIREYASYVGLKEPIYYCAAGVCKVLGDCGIENPRSGWSPIVAGYNPIYNHGDKNFPSMQSGLVFGVYFPSKGRVAHCGIIDDLVGDKVRTFEFNTSAAGSRNGDGNYYGWRPKWSLHIVSKYE
jgi:hypothetical protein